jgi:hypothetical protein
LTHLFQYLDRGNEALTGIKEDIETDIAERLPGTPFVNQVGFEYSNNDFVSVKDGVSMRSMTDNNLHILTIEQSSDSSLSAEVARAMVEAQEVEKLSTWFESAPIGTFLVFESLPIGKQKVAVSRIYQKTSKRNLNSGFVSLYGASVEIFNDFRKKIKVGKSDCNTELELLQNHYEVGASLEIQSVDRFVEKYISNYDKLKEDSSGIKHSFGLEYDKKSKIDNGLEKVRRQSKLTSIYVDAVKSLAAGQGKVSHELTRIDQILGIGLGLRQGDVISAQTARTVLSEVIRGITSAIDRADVDLLFDIEQLSSGLDMGYEAVSHYGGEARSEGVSYASEACLESSAYLQSGTNLNGNQSEFDILLNIFNPGEYPSNFGKRQIGVCKTKNCPSRKKPLVVVGGCGFCLECHHILEKNNEPPEKVYDEKWKKEIEREVKKKKVDGERLRRKQEESEKIRKQKTMQAKKNNLHKFKTQKPKDRYNSSRWFDKKVT